MTGFDGIEIQYPKKPKRWVYHRIFDDAGDGYFRIWMPDANGILEIQYPDGERGLVQGAEDVP